MIQLRTEKVYCEGSGQPATEVRDQEHPPIEGRRLAKCGTCERILRPKADDTLRRHSVRGANTASMDRTMEILWDYGTEAVRE